MGKAHLSRRSSKSEDGSVPTINGQRANGGHGAVAPLPTFTNLFPVMLATTTRLWLNSLWLYVLQVTHDSF